MCEISFKKQDVVPVYKQLREYLKKEIKTGRLSKGAKLLSEIDLANKCSLSRDTVRKALNELINEGLLVTQQGKGTFISKPKKLVSRGNNEIAVLLPALSVGQSYSQILDGINDYLRPRNYNLVLYLSTSSEAEEAKCIKALLHKKVEGLIWVICAYTQNKSCDNIRKMIQSAVPFALVDNYNKDIKTNKVIVDNFLSIYQAVEYLIKFGHQQIGFIIRSTTSSSVNDRLSGYKQALRDSGIKFNPKFIVDTYKKSETEVRQILKALLTEKKRPTAIINLATFDYLQFIVRIISKLGLKIPDNISLIQMENTEGLLCDPSLTFIDYPTYELGYEAAKLLLNKTMKSKKNEYAEIRLNAELVIRDSVSEVFCDTSGGKNLRRLV
ncbi:MAG: GntR family transcriptional regulator [bacterium]